MDSLTSRARELWVGLARVPIGFQPGGVTVAVAPASLLCPPGWTGIVVIGDAAIATVTEESQVAVVREALQGLALTNLDPVRAQLPTTAVLGPAALAYLAAEEFTPAPGHGETGRLPADHPDLAALAASMPSAEAGEAGIDEIQSDAFVIRAEDHPDAGRMAAAAGARGAGRMAAAAGARDAGRVVAAAGYRRWLGVAAHLSVLTAPVFRGHGFGGAAASAATADALAQGLLPQWRARVEPSRRIARSLGYRELGSQLSILLRA
ncbi:MAG: GNAT family N-acetyltransferase [Actinoplanes sp.]